MLAGSECGASGRVLEVHTHMYMYSYPYSEYLLHTCTCIHTHRVNIYYSEPIIRPNFFASGGFWPIFATQEPIKRPKKFASGGFASSGAPAAG
jgi:hypothetical protein